MKLDIRKTTQQLTELGRKAEELDEILKDVRVEINNVLWDLMELKDIEDKNERNTLKI